MKSEIDLGVAYKKMKKLPLTWEGRPVEFGTKAHTTDGVWWEFVDDGDGGGWRRLEGPDIPFIPLCVEI